MKIPQCYFDMKFRLGQRKNVWFISVKLKHAKELTYKVLYLCTCSCTEKCHLAENAYQNETNIIK